MNMYADELFEALRKVLPCHYSIAIYKPHISRLTRSLPISDINRMRIARLVDYPIQVRKFSYDISHIMDHGYAYLSRVLRPNNTIVTVHDLIPLLIQNGDIPNLTSVHYPSISKFSYNSLKHAGRIVCVSKNTRNDLIRFCDVNPHSVEVIPLGVSPNFSPCGAIEKYKLRKFYGINDDNCLVILITGFQNYKNHLVSLGVIERLQYRISSPIQVIRLGATKGDQFHSLSTQFNLKNPVISFPNMSRNQIYELYRLADCMLFPSLYEGFGMPPLEAMASGVPVIASNIPVIREVVGNAAILCSPWDVNGFVDSIENIWEDRKFRNRLIVNGIERAAKFTWDRCALATIGLYQQLCMDKD